MALSLRLLLSAALVLPLAAASAQQAAPAAASAAEAEDARLNAFLDAAFDASTALSPE